MFYRDLFPLYQGLGNLASWFDGGEANTREMDYW
jgi:hypothetical protein